MIRLSTPSMVTFVISAVLAAIAILGTLGILRIALFGFSYFWILVAAYGLLLLGTLLKRL